MKLAAYQAAWVDVLAKGDAAALAALYAEADLFFDKINVYRHTVFSSLVKALELTYPSVAHCLGSELFKALAVQFINQGGLPNTGCLDNYGEGFAVFLKEALASDLSAVYHLAEVDWRGHQAYMQSTSEHLAINSLTEFTESDWLNLKLAFKPGTCCIPLPKSMLKHVPTERIDTLFIDDPLLNGSTTPEDCVWLLVTYQQHIKLYPLHSLSALIINQISTHPLNQLIERIQKENLTPEGVGLEDMSDQTIISFVSTTITHLFSAAVVKALI